MAGKTVLGLTLAALMAGAALLPDEADAQSAGATKSQYNFVDLTTGTTDAKGNAQIRKFAYDLLMAEPDGAAILTAATPNTVAARFIDGNNTLLAIKVTNGCGLIGCQIFVFKKPDAAGKPWLRVLDEAGENMWVVPGPGGAVAVIALQNVASDPYSYYAYKDGKFGLAVGPKAAAVVKP